MLSSRSVKTDDAHDWKPSKFSRFDQNQEVVAIVAIIEDVSSNYENKLERDHLRAEHEAIVRSNRLKDEVRLEAREKDSGAGTRTYCRGAKNLSFAQFIGSLSHELRTVRFTSPSSSFSRASGTDRRMIHGYVPCSVIILRAADK